MLFVADRIPAELRRIVEFLNEQMDPAEVLALELRQFQGEGLKTIVPMLAEMELRHGSEALRVTHQIIDWIKQKTDGVWYGRGSKDGSVGSTVSVNGSKSYPIAVYSYYGQVEIRFQYMKEPFDNPVKREELRKRLNDIGINLVSGKQRPSIRIATFSHDDEKLRRFLDVMGWCVDELRSA
jgi:hypothetical protein